MILVDIDHTTSCVHVPRQISRDELVKLLPGTWVTNYEKLHKEIRLVQSSEPKLAKKKDGSVVIKFDCTEQKAEASSSLFSTLLTVNLYRTTKKMRKVDLTIFSPQAGPPAHSFDPSGNPIYHFRDSVARHCYWDLDCQCKLCTAPLDEEDDRPSAKKKKKKNRP